MAGNILDLTQFIQMRKQATEQPIPVEEYQLPDSEILMSPSMKLDILLKLSRERFLAGDLKAFKVQQLLSLLNFIYFGFEPPCELINGVTVRHILPNNTPIDYSVFAWGGGMARMKSTTEDSVPVYRPSYQLEITLVEIDKSDMDKSRWTYPEDHTTFTFAEDDPLTERAVRHFIYRMNKLVSINGGRGGVTDDGMYAVIMPHSPRQACMICLALENPIEKNTINHS